MPLTLSATTAPVNDDPQYVALLRQRIASANAAWFRRACRTPLGELLELRHEAQDELARLTEHGAPTDDRGISLQVSLERHIVSLECQIDEHPDSAWRRLEAVEEMRLR